MSAPTGNTYAEKWTFERTIITLHTIDRLSQDSSYLYLGSVLDAAGMYDDVWRYWKRKWCRHYEILDLMKRIMQRFEVRIFEKMARKEMPERVGMFALRHHYGWGKEPADPYEVPDHSYVDYEPIRDQRPQPQPETITEVTEIAKPIAIEEPKSEAPKAQNESQEKLRLTEAQMALVRNRYNQQNPRNKITQPLPFFYGTPPAGFDTIRFENGFFLNELD